MPTRYSTKTFINRIVLSHIFKKIAVSTSSSYRNTPCWEWQGSKDGDGYAKFTIRVMPSRKFVCFGVHRLLHHLFNTPVDPTLVCDHLCRVRHCVNPCHTELVTQQENLNRSPFYHKTHCINGHPLTDDNVRIYRDRYKCCRTCNRSYANKSRKKRTQADQDKYNAYRRRWRQSVKLKATS